MIIAEKLIFATRQQAADSTDSTTRRSNAVPEIKFFRYIGVIGWLQYIIIILRAGDGMDLFWQYAALWLSALTSATILPGTSEAGLAALVYTSPHAWLLALIVATIGNVIGSMISYGMGRLLPDKYQPNERVQEKLKRFGPWMLVLAWVLPYRI